jgi:glutamyl-tRNA synthetase
MENRVRFAPSPTGQVHIGNIRTAIFNWLFARHSGGKFLLRIEDTDLERSTDEAINKLLECMDWLALDHDEEIMYQTSQRPAHEAAAKKMLEEGNAYYGKAGEDGSAPMLFRMPWNTDGINAVREVGEASYELHAESPVTIDNSGVKFFTVSKKGKPVENIACLAGFKGLKLISASGEEVFDLDASIDAVFEGEIFEFTGCEKMNFIRREVFYNDMIKGELAKPLDNIKDLVIVRSDGSPVFHLANVLDDITQNVTHIIRGDDHVENTYRHILLYAALGASIPQYAHLPMIVNQAGKPYSKRDGDAFVGDFRAKGFLPEALFNYLTLLGWSPGDDREKMTRQEMVEAFSLERVKSAPAQFDSNKLLNMNGLYLAEMATGEFAAAVKPFFDAQSWASGVSNEKFSKVAALMQSRTKELTQVETWKYFFSDDFEYAAKQFRKQFNKDENRQALEVLAGKFAAISNSSAEAMLSAVEETEKQAELDHGKLFQPVRLAVTGVAGGADLDQTLALIGAQEAAKRIVKSLEYYAENSE